MTIASAFPYSILYSRLHSENFIPSPMRVVNQKRALHVKQVEVDVVVILQLLPLQAEQEQVSRERERY